METAKLRFCGVGLRYNPREISIRQERKIATRFAIGFGDVNQDIGICCKKVSGEGYLFGADVSKQYEELEKLLEKGEGMLVIPGFKPFLAKFEMLNIVAKPIPNLLTYSFLFVESQRGNSYD